MLWTFSWPHLELVTLILSACDSGLETLVPIWSSLSPGDFVPHLDLIAVDTFLASPGSGEYDPNLASPRSGDFGPHVWTIMI